MQQKKPSFTSIISVAALGGILSSYHFGVISGVLLFLQREFTLSIAAKQQIVSFLVLGATIGALSGGVISDRFGRKRTLFLSALVLVIGALMLMVADNLNTLLWGRLVTGYGVGLSSLIIPLYLAEVSSAKRRGAAVSIYQLAVTIGIFFSYLVNYLLSHTQSWRIAFAIAVGMGILQIIFLFCIPESPFWLLLHGERSQAKRLFQTFRKEENIETLIRKVETENKETQSVRLVHLFRRSIFLPVIIGILLSLFQQITGINTVIYYAPTIFQMTGLNNLSASLLATLGVGTVNLIATIFALKFIDKTGRRKLLLIGLTGMLVFLIILSLSTQYALLATISIMSYVVFFAISLGPVVWVMISEIYPLRYRGKAMSVATFVNWLANYGISATFLSMIATFGISWVFLIFAFMCFLGYIFVWKLVPETKGKTLTEIQKFWR